MSDGHTGEHGLVFDRVAKSFGGIQVLLDVSFVAPRGKVTALIGPNGAGKTTLINLACRVLPTSGGDIRYGTRSLLGLSPSQVVRSGIVRTFQEVRVFPFLSVVENVMMGIPGQRGERVLPSLLRTSGVRREERKNRQKALLLLDQMGIESLADEPAGELAFGHKKLVGLARAVATGAEVLLLDEPTAGVEPNLLGKVLGPIQDLTRSGNKVVLIVEHNMDVIREIADEVIVLMVRVIANGTVEAVLRDERVIRDYLGRVDVGP